MHGSNNISPLQELVGRFGELSVLVIGDSMLDVFHEGSTTRPCREAPVPLVEVETVRSVPGGAANTARNLSALGAKVRLLTALADDSVGETLIRALDDEGVELVAITRDPSAPTTPAAHRVTASGHVVARFDEGGHRPLTPAEVTAAARYLDDLHPAVDAVVLADYRQAVIVPGLIEHLMRHQQSDRRLLVADARDARRLRSVAPDVVKPNWDETAALLDLDGRRVSDRVATVQERAEELHTRTGASIVAVTLDREGVVLLRQGDPPVHLDTEPRPVGRTTGAGDTFVAGLTLALAAGASTHQAGRLALAAAGVVTTRSLTDICTDNDLRHALTVDHG